MQTRTAIVRAAKKLFSSSGYEGLRMERVASMCGINKATIYYHYNGKSALYNSIVMETLEASVERLSAAVDKAAPPAVRLRQFMEVMIMSDPQDARLIHRALIDGAAHLAPETFSLLFSMKFVLDAILAEGIAKGEFVRANSFVLMQLIMGTINGYILNTAFRARALSLVSGDSLLEKALDIAITREAFVDELYAMVMKAIGAAA